MVSFSHHDELKPSRMVFGMDSERIGVLKEHGTNYLLVREGFLFTKERYLPAAVIANYLGDDIYLSISRDVAERISRESLPPTGNPWYMRITSVDTITPITPPSSSR